MAYEAVHRYARISPRKVRPLADLIRGKYADEALDVLKYQPNRGARLLEKVLRSALANAEDRRAPNLHHLMVVDVRVDSGPMFRRMRPRARGMAAIIKKRMSHIHVALE
ncbi:MAG: 50S ribosomal protein L22 [Pirellulales bacterium]|nr:50S ribosomal protein L22 [Pirellulales bacterium]